MAHPSAAPPAGRVLMVQGTSSHAGKSTLVAALCRIFARAGYRVAPFKAQNMSNNAAVTPDGREIGRAQAAQAMAAGVAPTVDMSPVLLKPLGDRTSQVVLLGRPWITTDARDYYARMAELWPVVTAALDRLRAAHDIVVMEGAGSPAEINLAQYDIVNMRVARYAGAPVLLVGDIDRGGVFAGLYGTVMLLTPEERALVRGFVINKFRGDPSLLTPGFGMLQERTGIPTLGVLPYLDLSGLPAEDGLELDSRGRFAGVGQGAEPVVDIAILRLPRISNLDEFQPLAREAGVEVRFVRDAAMLGVPDLLIVPGTRSTMADLAWLRERGLDAAVIALRERGVPILGICGGYQMLGERILDPLGVDGAAGEMPGLGLLPVATTFAAEKVTERVRVSEARSGAFWQRHAPEPAGADTLLDAYEIHMGRTEPLAHARPGPAPFVSRPHAGGERVDGATSADGMVVGTYLHGLLEQRAFRRALVESLAARGRVLLPPAPSYDHDPAQRAFDLLAEATREQLDMAAIFDMAGLAHAGRIPAPRPEPTHLPDPFR